MRDRISARTRRLIHHGQQHRLLWVAGLSSLGLAVALVLATPVNTPPSVVANGTQGVATITGGAIQTIVSTNSPSDVALLPSIRLASRPYADRIVVGASILSLFGMVLGVWWIVRQINHGRIRSAKFWGTLALAVVFAYPLAFGPACWMSSRSNGRLPTTMCQLFTPLVRLGEQFPKLQEVLGPYAEMGAGYGAAAGFQDGQINWWIPVSWDIPTLQIPEIDGQFLSPIDSETTVDP
ncbi:MAG: hypothetical protein JSS02_23340 [Planctomycetes bacterium]|nr:hypothetical protein [Planctomycetota bacterium]